MVRASFPGRHFDTFFIKDGHMRCVGVLSGTIMMAKSHLLQKCKRQVVKNHFGEALVMASDQLVFIPRHGDDPHRHILPHLINHRANFQAMKDFGVTEIIGINSTGSLKKNLLPGMIVVPDDFLTLTATPSIHENAAVHITPFLDSDVRQKLIDAARHCNIDVVAEGVYWQATGPRLETRAEIRMMSNFADIVGMTMASEAVMAQEMEIPYASACSIDNFGNGLVEKPLSLEEILAGARKNADLMIRLMEAYVSRNDPSDLARGI